MCHKLVIEKLTNKIYAIYNGNTRIGYITKQFVFDDGRTPSIRIVNMFGYQLPFPRMDNSRNHTSYIDHSLIRTFEDATNYIGSVSGDELADKLKNLSQSRIWYVQVETKFGMKGFIGGLADGEFISSYPILLHEKEVNDIKRLFKLIESNLSKNNFRCTLEGDSIEAVSYHKLDTDLHPEKYLIKGK